MDITLRKNKHYLTSVSCALDDSIISIFSRYFETDIVLNLWKLSRLH